MDILEEIKSKLSNDYLLVFSLFGTAFSIFCLYPDIIEFSYFIKNITDNYVNFFRALLSKLLFFLPVKVTNFDAQCFAFLSFQALFLYRVNMAAFRSAKPVELLGAKKMFKDFLMYSALFFLISFPVVRTLLASLGKGDIDFSVIYFILIVMIILAVFNILYNRRARRLNRNYFEAWNHISYKYTKIIFIIVVGLFAINALAVASENAASIQRWFFSE